MLLDYRGRFHPSRRLLRVLCWADVLAMSRIRHSPLISGSLKVLYELCPKCSTDPFITIKGYFMAYHHSQAGKMTDCVQTDSARVVSLSL